MSVIEKEFDSNQVLIDLFDKSCHYDEKQKAWFLSCLDYPIFNEIKLIFALNENNYTHLRRLIKNNDGSRIKLIGNYNSLQEGIFVENVKIESFKLPTEVPHFLSLYKEDKDNRSNCYIKLFNSYDKEQVQRDIIFLYINEEILKNSKVFDLSKGKVIFIKHDYLIRVAVYFSNEKYTEISTLSKMYRKWICLITGDYSLDKEKSIFVENATTRILESEVFIDQYSSQSYH